MNRLSSLDCALRSDDVGMLCVANSASAKAQSGVKNGEWMRNYGGRSREGTRYAPLDQINAENFSKLEMAWRFKTDSLGPRPEFKFESTPLDGSRGALYDGRNKKSGGGYLDASHGRIALDA